MGRAPDRQGGGPDTAAGTAAARARAARLLLGLAILAVGVMLLLPAIPQDPAYHRLADQRTLVGIPHFWNVVSNLPFLLVGARGLAFLARADTVAPGGGITAGWERPGWLVVFAGVALTGLGSAYYHLAPSTSRLVWDRLPMTVVFMGLFAVVLGERLGARVGRRLLLPLVALGVASVAYWALGEARGAGDLRPYGLVQFYPMLAIPLTLAVAPPRYTRTGDLVAVVGWYGAAKLFEWLDVAVLTATGLVSGHSVKHLLAATGAYWLLRMVRLRRPAPGPDAHPR